MGLTRLPEVDVDVNQPGADQQVLGVDDLSAGLLLGGKTAHDPPCVYVDVGHVVPAIGRIDDSSILYPGEVGHGVIELGSGRRFEHGLGRTARTQVENGHAHGDAIGDLFENHRSGGVGQFGVDFVSL